MSRAYIYMQHPETGTVATLGRLTLQGNVGEFVYAPDAVKKRSWVPDPFNYPIRAVGRMSSSIITLRWRREKISGPLQRRLAPYECLGDHWLRWKSFRGRPRCS